VNELQWILPTVSCKFDGEEFACPKDSVTYLEHLYGKDVLLHREPAAVCGKLAELASAVDKSTGGVGNSFATALGRFSRQVSEALASLGRRRDRGRGSQDARSEPLLLRDDATVAEAAVPIDELLREAVPRTSIDGQHRSSNDQKKAAELDKDDNQAPRVEDRDRQKTTRKLLRVEGGAEASDALVMSSDPPNQLAGGGASEATQGVDDGSEGTVSVSDSSPRQPESPSSSADHVAAEPGDIVDTGDISARVVALPPRQLTMPFPSESGKHLKAVANLPDALPPEVRSAHSTASSRVAAAVRRGNKS